MSDAIRLSGLWKSDKPTREGKPYYKGKTQETVTIPAGSMVMLFMNESENPRAPRFSITVLPPLPESQAPPQEGPDEGDGDFGW